MRTHVVIVTCDRCGTEASMNIEVQQTWQLADHECGGPDLCPPCRRLLVAFMAEGKRS